MNRLNGHARSEELHVGRTGEHKRSSSVGLGKGRQSPAGAGDITPTQSRSTSPFRSGSPGLANGFHNASASESTSPVTNGIIIASGGSVDPSTVDLSHAQSVRDAEHASLISSTIYDSHPSSSSSSPFTSHSLTPKHRSAALAAPDGILNKDMSDSSSRPNPSGPPRSTPAARQQLQQHQQRGLQPYGYYTPSPASDSGFPRNNPSSPGQGGHASFVHTQQSAAMQRPTGFGSPYTMSPPPSSMFPQHHVQQQYSYPQISIPGIPPPLTHAHSHSPSEFYSVAHSASPTQPPLYGPSFHTSIPPEQTPSPTLVFDYEGAGSAGRGPNTEASSPFSTQQPFAPFSFHPTLTVTPQFTHSHSPFSPPFPTHQGQQAQRQQYPPSYTYMPRASPASSENNRQAQQQPSGTWWFIPPHSGSPSTGTYPSVYYVDAYGNPSNPTLGLGRAFPQLQSPSSSHPLDPSALSSPDLGNSPASRGGARETHIGPHVLNEEANKPDSVVSSSRGSLSPSPLVLGESVSERGHKQEETQSRPGARRPYLPNPPAQRSEWVMWVGNVPADATHDELWRFFTRSTVPSSASPAQTQASYHSQQLQQPPHLPAGLLSPSGSSSASDTNPRDVSGVQSVFLIARSNCAFVNYTSSAQLAEAVQHFNGVPLRPGDPRCPRLVCRVRGKEEDSRAGVGAQRGTGIHMRWVREQREREKASEQEQKRGVQKGVLTDSETSASEPPGTPLSAAVTDSGAESPTRGSGRRVPHHSSSSGSTTSGFLARYFPKRYFILKSLTQHDLDLSVEKGIWATQPHNETVLNQAFRNSSDVYLIFSVNKSGEFFGYARMTGPIGKAADRVSWASRTDSQHSQHSHSPTASFSSSVPGKGSQVGETIPEENEGSSPEGKEVDNSGGKERDPQKEMRSFMLFSPSEHRLAQDSPQPVTPATQKWLANAEEADVGKIPVSAGRNTNTAPPADRRFDGLKDSLPLSSETRSSVRPSSPTSAPAVMGQRDRKMTHMRLGNLGSETLDPQSLRRHLPDIELDSEAPLRAIRDHDSHESEKGRPIETDFAKCKGETSMSASGSGVGSKLREVIQADQVQSPTRKDPESGPIEPGSSAKAREGPREQGDRDGLPTPWGSPFKVQWIRVKKLPFTRTRHLRNPWNHEREVKVSRDGTELEPSVGQQLLDEWNKDEPPSSVPTPPSVGAGGTGSATPGAARRSTGYRRTQL